MTEPISEKELATLEGFIAGGTGQVMVDGVLVSKVLAEVRRLREENARLKARKMSKDNIARLQRRMSEGIQT